MNIDINTIDTMFLVILSCLKCVDTNPIKIMDEAREIYRCDICDAISVVIAKWLV